MSKLLRLLSLRKTPRIGENTIRLYEWALSNGIRHFLFYVSDREARNLTDSEKNERLVRQDKMVLHYVNENRVLWKGSPESDFTARDYQAVGAKDFSRRLSTKVIDAMEKKAENGWYPGNHPPLGYICQKQKDRNGRELKRGAIIVPDPNPRKVAQVVREYKLRAEGFSIALHCCPV